LLESVMRLENWKVSAKILALIGLLSVVTAFTTIFSGHNLKVVDGFYSEVVERSAPARTELVRLSRALNQIGYAGYRTIAHEGSSEKAKQAAAAVTAAFQAGAKFLAEVKRLEPAQAATYAAYETRLEEIRPVVQQAIAFGIANDDERARATMAKVDELVVALVEDMTKFNIGMAEKTKAESRNASAAAASAIFTNYLIGFGGLALCLGASIFMARVGIARPIQNLSGRMTRLAEGDLDSEVAGVQRGDEIGQMARAVQVFKEAAIDKIRLEQEAAEQRGLTEEERVRNEKARAASAKEQAFVVTSIGRGLDALAKGELTFRLSEAFPGEYRKLQDDFNAALTTLHDTMKTIAGATEGIRSGTGEVSQAADDLSKRTEQQAASLEETAAALDEITATVRKTADGANHARDVVTNTKSDAEKSGEVVGGAVQAMAEIDKSSKEISNIIGVIDEIAFQTNLLALNAGVEAARAGEAGKGFAVVASEVRALAQRSAEAAKEIKALIQASSTQVASGVDLVGQAGKALERIVVQVAEINAIVIEIAASAKEQATGLAEVNTAVNQMDQVTQQNAAMVEQSTAASHSLAQEAEELGNLIARFEIGAGSKVVPIGKPAAPKASGPQRLVQALKNAGGRAVSAVRKPSPAVAEESWEEF
jgi:methyl-accepting chemotaxis protein